MVLRMSDPADNLNRYLVGGIVRDRLLGVPSGDSDWVVVGSTPEEMVSLGFKPVGADFPVFLHPVTGDEFALARTERKSAKGYHGFVVHAAPDVTLEEDLARRDLTINAMAEDSDGNLIDPFNGKADVEARVLRHVSDAFAEDPVRLLRVARFSARFHALGFTVADDTLALMRELVSAGEVDALVAERVWAETRRALDEAFPGRFIEVLRECEALKVLFPEIDALFGVPQPEKHHPEIDTGVHVMLAMNMSATLNTSNRARLAVMLHDLGKALTPEDVLPRHIAHESRGVDPVRQVCERLKVPTDYRELAVLVCRHHLNSHRLFELNPKTVVKLLEQLRSFGQGSFVDDFTAACECDARGRAGLVDKPYPQAAELRRLVELTRNISARDVLAKTPQLEGRAIGEAIRRERIRIISESRQNPDDTAAH